MLKNLSALALLAAAATVGAAAPVDPAAPLGRTHLAGTSLTIVPAIGYEHATVSVSGPNGYAVAKEIAAGQPLSIDLFSEAGLSGDRPPGEALRPGVGPQTGWSALPDGRYRYEVLLVDVAGEMRVHTGSFFVEAGSLISSEAMRSRPAPAAKTLSGGERISDPGASTEERSAGSSVATRSTNVDDLLQILDTANDGSTHILLEGDYPTSSSWWLQNRAGDVRFIEFTSAEPAGVDRAALVGQSLGLGTTAPGADLHIRSPGISNIFLEDSAPGGTDWGIWNQGSVGLLFGSGSASSIIPVRLIIRPNGNIGVGTAFPAAKLQVGGSAIIDADLSVGSSRAIKHDITRVADEELLAGLQELAIHRWRYREDPAQARHIGPMAEDFHRLFGVGIDGAHLSPTDTSGVALAAVKALHEQLALLTRETARAHRELDALRAELAALRCPQTTSSAQVEEGQ